MIVGRAAAMGGGLTGGQADEKGFRSAFVVEKQRAGEGAFVVGVSDDAHQAHGWIVTGGQAMKRLGK